jgi:hypothetical protein
MQLLIFNFNANLDPTNKDPGIQLSKIMQVRIRDPGFSNNIRIKFMNTHITKLLVSTTVARQKYAQWGRKQENSQETL